MRALLLQGLQPWFDLIEYLSTWFLGNHEEFIVLFHVSSLFISFISDPSYFVLSNFWRWKRGLIFEGRLNTKMEHLRLACICFAVFKVMIGIYRLYFVLKQFFFIIFCYWLAIPIFFRILSCSVEEVSLNTKAVWCGRGDPRMLVCAHAVHVVIFASVIFVVLFWIPENPIIR